MGKKFDLKLKNERVDVFKSSKIFKKHKKSNILADNVDFSKIFFLRKKYLLNFIQNPKKNFFSYNYYHFI